MVKTIRLRYIETIDLRLGDEMGGIGFIFVVALYIFIAYKVVEVIEHKWLKAVVIGVALLIPTADAVYGRFKLKQMCEAGAGLKVYRVVEHVEGFMDNSLDYWIREGGYQFIEDYPVNGTVTRYSKQKGQIIREDHMFPKSQYRLSLRHLNEKKSYRQSQYLVEEIASGEIFATDTQIGFNGGWVERLIAAFSDGGVNPTWCTTSMVEPVLWHKRIVLSTLKH